MAAPMPREPPVISTVFMKFILSWQRKGQPQAEPPSFLKNWSRSSPNDPFLHIPRKCRRRRQSIFHQRSDFFRQLLIGGIACFAVKLHAHKGQRLLTVAFKIQTAVIFKLQHQPALAFPQQGNGLTKLLSQLFFSLLADGTVYPRMDKGQDRFLLPSGASVRFLQGIITKTK